MDASDRQTDPSEQAPRFQLGRRQLAVAIGFVVTVLVCDFALGLSPYRVMVPPQVEQNQVQLFAHTQRSEPEDVLVIGSSRVLEGIEPNMMTQILSYRPEQPVEVVRLPIQGMRSWTLSKIVRELVVPRPPRELLLIGLEARFFYFMPDETARPLGFQMLASTEDVLTTNWLALDRAQAQELSLAPLRGVRAPWVLPRLIWGDTDAYVDYLHETRGLPLVNFRELSRQEFEFARSLREEIEERDADYATADLRPFDLDTFFALLDVLEDLPCKVAFVRLPVLEEFDAIQARQLEEFERRVVAVVEQRGFEYHDLNRFGQLRAPELFRNPSHLNDVGRRQASQILAMTVVGPAVIGAPPPGATLPVPQPVGSRPQQDPQNPAGPAAGAVPFDRGPYRERALEVFERDDLSEEEKTALIDQIRAAADAAEAAAAGGG